MGYENLLMRYGSRQESAETRLFIYVADPQKLTTPRDVVYRDQSAAGDITQLEGLIEDLKDYRKALAERYAQLETMPYSYRLRLERYKHWKGNVEYFITIKKEMEDGSKIDELREVYPGKERHKAIARYEELRKQRPGIVAEKDIEKGRWE